MNNIVIDPTVAQAYAFGAGQKFKLGGICWRRLRCGEQYKFYPLTTQDQLSPGWTIREMAADLYQVSWELNGAQDLVTGNFPLQNVILGVQRRSLPLVKSLMTADPLAFVLAMLRDPEILAQITDVPENGELYTRILEKGLMQKVVADVWDEEQVRNAYSNYGGDTPDTELTTDVLRAGMDRAIDKLDCEEGLTVETVGCAVQCQIDFNK